ncbi:MAG: ceramidase [Pseudomonadales bacterium]|nr:ceramidase [Pseudomonadales bacterium]
MNLTRHQLGSILIAVVTVLGIILAMQLDPIAQDVSYHSFADQRRLWGVANFFNVFSNLAFVLVAFYALLSFDPLTGARYLREIRYLYLLFYAAVALVALGSGYYHLQPDNQSLFWDRLPMTMAFMLLFAVIVAEYVSVRLAKIICWPLLAIGVASVCYWQLSEANGASDLRLYLLVQFLPMLIIPLILVFFSNKQSANLGYWQLLAAYLLAKLCEHFDQEIYNLIAVISGHSLKHLVAAAGLGLLIRFYQHRQLNPVGAS